MSKNNENAEMASVDTDVEPVVSDSHHNQDTEMKDTNLESVKAKSGDGSPA